MARPRRRSEEAYARYLAQGLRQDDAAVLSGIPYDERREVARRLKDEVELERKRSEAKKAWGAIMQAQRLTGLDKAWVIAECRGLYENAMAIGDLRVAAVCIKLLGNEVGAFTEKRDLTVTNSYAGWSAEQLAAHMAETDRELERIRGVRRALAAPKASRDPAPDLAGGEPEGGRGKPH